MTWHLSKLIHHWWGGPGRGARAYGSSHPLPHSEGPPGRTPVPHKALSLRPTPQLRFLLSTPPVGTQAATLSLPQVNPVGDETASPSCSQSTEASSDGQRWEINLRSQASQPAFLSVPLSPLPLSAICLSLCLCLRRPHPLSDFPSGMQSGGKLGRRQERSGEAHEHLPVEFWAQTHLSASFTGRSFWNLEHGRGIP